MIQGDMEYIKTIVEMTEYSKGTKLEGKTIGFVPTMGFLHEGHLALVRAAIEECDKVVVSVFVNPTQFGLNEDLDTYPKDLERDIELLEKEGVDAVFIPSDSQMYPEGYSTYISIEGALTDVMCGKSRPGHFKGVATVIAKLLNLVYPDKMYLGQKDAQQVAVIRHLVGDLDFPVEIRVIPTVREHGGLAMSSRNTHLSEAEKRKALSIYKSLSQAEEMLTKGSFQINDIKDEMGKILVDVDSIDYIEILDYNDLGPVDEKTKEILVGVAAYVGSTRLIDNVIVTNKNIR